ncbi:hypothetical protein Nocox_29855 [Nonomuraea coxensis DSM 45129]|uniref:Integral membrane protein n=1 Tax=Nonomuraea coxensis DSM 45129 TaxID=1122611 RepID=A0ABX8U718_9ACTN|nr:hypothetical protein [Nonomuraea coxensis]QYC43555.1 hypothetical protein Nocox_29855 [Nonomuraea coxensis DSM 45129]
MSTGDELRAAVSARRELGPEFEDAIVESFLDKMGKEVDRRVDERLAQTRQKSSQRRASHGQRLALAIVSLSLGTIATLALALATEGKTFLFVAVWVGIIIVNAIFNGGQDKG